MTTFARVFFATLAIVCGLLIAATVANMLYIMLLALADWRRQVKRRKKINSAAERNSATESDIKDDTKTSTTWT